MELVSTVVNAMVIGMVGLILAWLGKGRFEAIDRQFEVLDDRMDRLDTRMDAFQASLDAMRSDLTQVALAVGVRGRATNA
jgi:hypothetical protein